MSAALPLDERDTSTSALISCMTGHTKEIVPALFDAWPYLTPLDRLFLKKTLMSSFPDAGRHARHRPNEAGVWAPFDTARWAFSLGWHRQHISRMRDRLITLGILRYEPDRELAGCGWLGWNLALDEWQPLRPDYNQRRYTRKGAGRPHATPTIDKQASVTSLIGSNETDQAGVTSLTPAEPADHPSNWLRSPANRVIKLVTLGRCGAAETPAADATEEWATGRTREEPEPANAGAVAAATRPPLGGNANVSRQDDALPLPAWPPQGNDTRDHDYYKACLVLNEANPALTVTRVAHLALRTPYTRRALARLGAIVVRLKQHYGDDCRPWGIVLTAVLKTSGEEIEGNRLNYVEGLAMRLMEARTRRSGSTQATRAAGGRAMGSNGHAGTSPMLNRLIARLDNEPVATPSNANTPKGVTRHE